MKLKEQLKKLKSATPICKICFKPVDEVKRSSICSGCFNKFEGLYETMNVEGVKLYSIYEYNDFIRQLIYQLKGCFDIEIAQVFLKRQRCYLKIKYLNYVLVHVPSSKEDDERRGFNHVREIFKSLNLKSLNVLKKKKILSRVN